MNLTNEDRDEVATILRCAADDITTDGEGWVVDAACELEAVKSHFMVAVGASTAMFMGPYARKFSRDDERAALLEAALLVEEGQYP